MRVFLQPPILSVQIFSFALRSQTPCTSSVALSDKVAPSWLESVASFYATRFKSKQRFPVRTDYKCARHSSRVPGTTYCTGIRRRAKNSAGRSRGQSKCFVWRHWVLAACTATVCVLGTFRLAEPAGSTQYTVTRSTLILGTPSATLYQLLALIPNNQ
jgi:hypothetical protein